MTLEHYVTVLVLTLTLEVVTTINLDANTFVAEEQVWKEYHVTVLECYCRILLHALPHAPR